MKYTLSPILPTSVGVLLLILGFWLYRTGGRPMLFGGMALWGMGAVALLLSLALTLPMERCAALIHALMALVVIGALAMALLLGYVLVNSSSRIAGTPKTLVVLGANLWNHEPSPILMARLEQAAEYLTTHPDTNVVVTGGMGDDEPISEASCMARVLEECGVSAKRILLEDTATNTNENLRLTKELLEEKGISTENLLVVSSGPHMARVRLLARRNGLKVSTLAAPMPGGIVYKIYFCLREGAALVKSFLLDRG